MKKLFYTFIAITTLLQTNAYGKNITLEEAIKSGDITHMQFAIKTCSYCDMYKSISYAFVNLQSPCIHDIIDAKTALNIIGTAPKKYGYILIAISLLRYNEKMLDTFLNMIPSEKKALKELLLKDKNLPPLKIAASKTYEEFLRHGVDLKNIKNLSSISF